MATAVRAADGDPSDQARRDQLNAERAAAQARYDQTVRECERAFAVSDCVNRAKAERRTALERLSREQATLDDAERKRRAEERRQRIAQKQARQQLAAERAAAAAASSPEMQVRPPRQPLAASAAKSGRRHEPRSAQAETTAEAEAAERAAQAEQRRERAQAHEEAVRKRNAERAAQRAPAAPLPVPQASAATSAVR